MDNSGVNEFLAQLIGEDKISAELANDVLRNNIRIDEALDIYYLEKLYMEMKASVDLYE